MVNKDTYKISHAATRGDFFPVPELRMQKRVTWALYHAALSSSYARIVMSNVCVKFQVPTFTFYSNMKDSVKCIR